jgi:hypothetical protein
LQHFLQSGLNLETRLWEASYKARVINSINYIGQICKLLILL